VKRTIFAVLLALASTSAYAFNAQDVCGMGAPCRAGSHVITHADKAEPFYACPTRELSDYIGTVIGMMAMQSLMGVVLNLSPQTGEPEWKGETETIVSGMRSKAHVKTFDEAASQCSKGRNGIRAIVLNHEDDALSIWVTVRNGNFWAPAAAFDSVRQ
jgi:hypothetical protein